MPKLSRRAALKAGVMGSLMLSACSPAARVMLTDEHPITAPPHNENVRRMQRLINRAGYGPRPGQLEASAPYEDYLDDQLNPQRIDDTPTDLLIRNLHLYHKGYGPLHFADHEDIERELVRATLIRAVTTRRHVYEALVEFWSDHFAIFAQKDQYMARFKLVDDRDVIRPHALGTFPDLLMASATSPAMLVYLDNVTNYSQAPNENYARELLELHTVGIEGGYTQTDVQELARAFTGWTVHREGLKEGQWFFNPEVHDPGEKTVMGHTIPANSGEEGIRTLLNWLALHPATAHYISHKLVKRFVADTPPRDLIEQAAQTFLKTQGDIKAVLRVIFASDAFFTAPPKIKRPMTYVASVLRALEADITTQGYNHLYERLDRMGHKPFAWPMPDGYPDTTHAWTGTLLSRWNFTLDAVSGRIDGITIPFERLTERLTGEDPAAKLTTLSRILLGSPLDDPTHQALIAHDNPRHIVAVLLAAPAFQWAH